MNIAPLKGSEEILAVMLFGSTARKDRDAYSDKDVFVLCQDLDVRQFFKIRHNLILPVIGENASVCTYMRKDVILMAEKGSLFLWHLKLQGKVIFSKEGVLEEVFNRLKPYNNYDEDLRYYTELLADVKRSSAGWETLTEFDLSLLFTIARNTCILLCHYRGTPKFGRSNAYLAAKRIFGEELPMPQALYSRLCSWKLWYERGIKTSNKDSRDESDLRSILEHVEKLLEFAREECL